MKYSNGLKVILPLAVLVSMPMTIYAADNNYQYSASDKSMDSDCPSFQAEIDNAKESYNKQLVLDAFNGLIVNGNEDALSYWADDYIQHNPQIANGSAPVKSLFIDNRVANMEYDIGSAFAEGDFVVLHSRVTGFSATPLIVVDIMKVKDDKIVEHWDVVQDEVVAADTTSGNAMFPIERDEYSESTAQEQENRNTAIKVLNSMFGLLDASAVDQYFADDYIQHSPTIANGKQPVKDFINSIPKGTDLEFQVGFAVAEGDYVVLQSRYGALNATPFIAIDVYRFEDGKIKEHWDVIQNETPITDTVSGNPMFPAF
jgi:predicted SnoaL-like aldol condensation-catalyzing enzyme